MLLLRGVILIIVPQVLHKSLQLRGFGKDGVHESLEVRFVLRAKIGKFNFSNVVPTSYLLGLATPPQQLFHRAIPCSHHPPHQGLRDPLGLGLDQKYRGKSRQPHLPVKLCS